ncbi:T-antigen [Betapolyomavirus secumuris]|uniref:Large T antigen n=1 Tax=Murine polyomavirus (strain Kilham) TaxID=10638 RepID=LT_POVMK|nr:T-antigen [Betapolyomavirus secumuris]P24597.2 RecName: Full=Large T antigen; Short=LT; Short=LT-AG [Kilham polyomavirus]AAA46551.1 T-antigen [Betapolyomavirus secumuris]
MDHQLTREESQRLMHLLKLPMEQYGNFPLMRKAFLRACKIVHPDKGGSDELSQELISLYRRLEESLPCLSTQDFIETDILQIPSYGTPEWDEWWKEFNKDFDLFCNEAFDRSDDEQEPQPDDSAPIILSPTYPARSQATPPKKKAKMDSPNDMPADLMEYLSCAILSNKTLPCFLIYTTLEKVELLYNKLSEEVLSPRFNQVDHKYGRKYVPIFIITGTKHRVSAVFNYCATYCSVSFIVVKGVIKEYPLYCHLCVEPYSVLQESIEELNSEFFDAPEDAAKNVNWVAISEYALKINCDDIYLLMGLYKEFQSPVPNCSKCENRMLTNHFKFHKEHHENAFYLQLVENQKTICQQAVDGVIATKTVDMAQMTRNEQLAARFDKLFERLEVILSAQSSYTISMFMAGIVWFENLFPGQSFKDLLLELLECMVSNIPKRRYWLFTGPVNTGKTTLAAAVLDLGGTIYISDCYLIELEVANSQIHGCVEVLAEKVKIRLPPGQGINNLDNLRDHLDGAVKVNLEKKHLNKKTQIFPPGIVTSNEYFIPFTLRVRFCKKLVFKFSKYQYLSLKKTECLGRYRILQNGCTLLLLLIYHCDLDDFAESIQGKVRAWKERVNSEISVSTYLEMRQCCLEGRYSVCTKYSNANTAQ